jgi:hypothetical protein
MKRQAIRGLVLFGLTVLAYSSVLAQNNNPDSVQVRDHKDSSIKTHSGLFKVSPAGFQVVSDNKVVNVTPDDIVKFSVGDLPGVDRETILSAISKEDKKEYDGARTAYVNLLKKTPPIQDPRSKRYLEFKKLQMTNKLVDELDADKGWKEKAETCVKEWISFLSAEDLNVKSGWEQWPAVRASTRLQVELGKFEEAARTWAQISKNPNMPPDARLEASLQEVDLQIRGGKYPIASANAAEALKTATGAKKDRLNIYVIAAKAADDNKPLEGVDKIKAEMDKSKDATVHATGFSMMGELYLAGKKHRDAMWMFLWVETVMNQDKDESLKAISRLIEIFEAQADEDQVKKYRDKIKRFRGNF